RELSLGVRGGGGPVRSAGRCSGCGRGNWRLGGRGGRVAVRAGIDVAGRSLVQRDGPAAQSGGVDRAGAGATRAGRRLPCRAGSVPDPRAGGGDRAEARPAILDLSADAMSARPLPRSRLDNLIPPLVDGHALVALVPATGDLKWATAAAWDVARAAAQHGRRVALVDLWIEDPTLHE